MFCDGRQGPSDVCQRRQRECEEGELDERGRDKCKSHAFDMFWTHSAGHAPTLCRGSLYLGLQGWESDVA